MGLAEELGKKKRLMIVKKVEFGVYLGNNNDKVLLPKKQVPKGLEIGDPVEVFLYKDSSDRLIATTQEPKITLGELAVLKVVDTGRIGAFLDWGLEKDLLLPFKEQTAKVKKGDEILVALYIDKSNRLCATMKIYDHLRTDSPYQKDDQVNGIIYEISDNFGVFVAVDNCYSALIPKREAYGKLRVGDRVHARVVKVKEDGKLDLSVREKAFLQMDADAALIMKRMEEYGGKLPFTDKADPELIQKEFGLSKNAFKRAVGRLLKEGKIKIREKNIEIRDKKVIIMAKRGSMERRKGMKVQNITDIDAFFKVVDSCSGKVELVTGEGDRLNLKSKLSQYVSMANIFSNGEIPELEIVAHEPEDIDKLVQFMINGK